MEDATGIGHGALGVVEAQSPLNRYNVCRSLEWRGSRRAGLPRPADRGEEALETRRRDDPEHDERVAGLVDDLVLDVRAHETGRARHERMAHAVDDDPAPAAEADLELHLVAVGMLADAPARRDGLVAHRQAIEARVARMELRVGVAAGRDRLPVRRTLVGLHDDGMAPDRVR